MDDVVACPHCGSGCGESTSCLDVRSCRERLYQRLAATRRVVNELRSKWYSEEGHASLALIASELDRNAG